MPGHGRNQQNKTGPQQISQAGRGSVLTVSRRSLDRLCYFIFLSEFFITLACPSVGMGSGEWMIDAGEASERGPTGTKKGPSESCMMLLPRPKRGGSVSKKARGPTNSITDLNLNPHRPPASHQQHLAVFLQRNASCFVGDAP